MFSKGNSTQTYVTKVIGKGGFIYARVMYGTLADQLCIDLKAFELEELEVVLRDTLLPDIDDKLQVYKGGNHIRVFKDINKSGSENLLFIGDSAIIIDGEPLRQN